MLGKKRLQKGKCSHLEDDCSTLRDNGGLDKVFIGGEKWLKSIHILKVEMTEFPSGLDMI